MSRKPRTKRTVDADGNVTVAGRNANGEGSTYWDAGKERWRATFVDPMTGRRRTVLGATRTEAEQRRDAKLEQLIANAPKGLLGTNPTVGALTDWWLDRVIDVRPNTENTYRNLCAHIHRELGRLPVTELTIERVRMFVSDLRDDDIAPKLAANTVVGIRGRLLQVCEEAVTLGYLTSNPVAKVPAPKTRASAERTVKRILTVGECQRLVEACAAHRLGAAVAILFIMGNRSNEALGLAWSDIDFAAETATIRRGSTYCRGIGQRLDDTKTAGTAGVHILPPSVINLLEHRKQVQETERREAGLKWRTITYRGVNLDMVFTQPDGSLVLSQKLYRAVQDCCITAGVDPANVGTHSGRRAVVTHLFTAGLDLGDIARHVGHANPTTTAGYVGDLGNRPRRTAELAASLLDPAVQ